MNFSVATMDGSNKPIFTTASETLDTSTTESYLSESQTATGLSSQSASGLSSQSASGLSSQSASVLSSQSASGLTSLFSPLAPAFRSRASSELIGLMNQEPRTGDIAPSALNIDNEILMNFRNSGADSVFDDVDHRHNNFFMGGVPREESVSSNLWGEDAGTSASSVTRNDEMSDTFDFLAKSLSSANSYVSLLTREQLSVLRAFRPSLLYEFLQEVAKVRSDKRLRRAGPNECAFCKNNGENEECYSSHALKDWRGRVLCPVLRAFRCPRCGSTGDRAHTIKYCPDHGDNAGLDRPGGFTRRRVGPSSSSLLFGQQPQPAPATVPAAAPPTIGHGHSTLWNFNI